MVTYFMLCGSHMKIGKSENAEVRLKAIQTGSPETVVLLGTQDGDNEIYWHRKFANLRRNGEWFVLAPALVEAVMPFIRPEYRTMLAGTLADQDVDDRLISIDKAAELCGTGRGYVRTAISRGELPASVMCGRRFSIRYSDLTAFIKLKFMDGLRK